MEYLLNSKEVKILDVNQRRNGLIEVDIGGRKKKVRCSVCNKFTGSVHDKLKSIRSVYLDSCESSVDLIIHKNVLDILPSRKKGVYYIV